MCMEMDFNTLREKNLAACPPKEPDWQVVRRKRRYPDHWRPGGRFVQEVYLPRAKTYVPYQTRPTYAQAVANQSNPKPQPLMATAQTPTTSPTTSPPNSPRSPTYYLSPHSPTPLRFPPSPKFAEWKGRCFKCCRTGHSIAVCRNPPKCPPKCGRCWKSGHTGNKCKEGMTKQAPMPAGVPANMNPLEMKDLDFKELLTGDRPLNAPPLPTNRPKKIRCFVDCDAEYHHEVKRLQLAVLVKASGISINFELSVDKVAEWIAKSNLIPEREVTIAALTNQRFLVIMPEGLAPETLVEAIPYEVWEEGVSFHIWDPMEDTTKVTPEFKVMVDLVDIPPPLYREKEVINAVSSFGVYLGTVAQPNPADLSIWTVVVATEKLEDVPYAVSMVVEGKERDIEV